MSWIRLGTGVSAQPGNARAAAATAAATSCCVQQGASAICPPVLGSITGMYRSVLDSIHSLSTQYLSRLTCGAARGGGLAAVSWTDPISTSPSLARPGRAIALSPSEP
jgi:hypothetical protein